MKQGHASYTAPQRKVEPKPRAVDPGAADQLGQALANKRVVEKLYCGHGYKAPMAGSQTHKSGSQGRH